MYINMPSAFKGLKIIATHGWEKFDDASFGYVAIHAEFEFKVCYST